MDPNQFESRVAALEQWKEDRIRQQIVYPLDFESQTILNKYFISNVGSIVFTSVSGQEFRSILLQQDGKINIVNAYEQLIRYTVNTTTNILTLGPDVITGSQGILANDAQVYVSTTDTPPAPLQTAVPYYVVSSTGTTIKLSLTVGGAAIDITTAGVGTQYISSFLN